MIQGPSHMCTQTLLSMVTATLFIIMNNQKQQIVYPLQRRYLNMYGQTMKCYLSVKKNTQDPKFKHREFSSYCVNKKRIKGEYVQGNSINLNMCTHKIPYNLHSYMMFDVTYDLMYHMYCRNFFFIFWQDKHQTHKVVRIKEVITGNSSFICKVLFFSLRDYFYNYLCH